LSIYHDFVIGPRSTQIFKQSGSRPTPAVLAAAGQLRKRASIIGRIEAILALIVLLLAIMLVRGVPL